MSSKINIDKIIDNELKNMFLQKQTNRITKSSIQTEQINDNNLFDNNLFDVYNTKNIFYNSNIKVYGKV